MSANVEVRLGSEAVAYIEECLKNGNTLSQLLLQAHDLNGGQVKTFLPENVSDEAAKEFTTGGKLATPKPETNKELTAADGSKWLAVPTPSADTELVTIIQNFLRAEQSHVCILENAVAKPKDAWLSSLSTRVLTFTDEVYHLLTQDDANDPKNILNTINRANSWQLIGALTSVPRGKAFAPHVLTLADDDLKTMAEETKMIVVSAYDGEGHLIWNG